MEDILEKTEHIILLHDMYGDMLTDKQNEYLSLYYEEDLSLSEIAAENDVSRNAVFDNLKRAIKTMEKYEEKLHLLERHQKRMELIDKIEEENKQKHEDIDEYLEMLRRL